MQREALPQSKQYTEEDLVHRMHADNVAREGYERHPEEANDADHYLRAAAVEANIRDTFFFNGKRHTME